MIFDKRRDRVIAYKKFFGTLDGKIILSDLMNKYHFMNHHGGSEFKEGQRSVVLEILKNCHTDIEKLDQILKGDPK